MGKELLTLKIKTTQKYAKNLQLKHKNDVDLKLYFKTTI